jgi:TolB-like protein
LVSSTAFARAERLGELLRYLVEQTLQGRAGPLKEYVIGTEALGRPTTFDPKTDSVVRVEAHRLRARLVEYYAGEGAGNPVVIELPRGGYTPVFIRRPATAALATTEEPPAVVAPGPSWRRRATAAALAVLMLSAAAAVLAFAFNWPLREDAPAATIAVLPFEVASDNPQDRLLVDGFSDELTAALATLPRLRVIARSSASQVDGRNGNWQALADRLNVESVVRGSVRRVGTRLRVTIQLIAVPGAYHLWADSYERDEGGLVSIETDVSRRIGLALRLPRAPASGSDAHRPLPTAYDLYLKGRSFRAQATAEGLLQSATLFEAATAADPAFATAFAATAEVHATLAFHGLEPPAEGMAKAEAPTARALALAGRRDEARALLAQLESSPVPSGTPETERAFIHTGLGERDQAFACLDRALAAQEGEVLFLDVAPAFDVLRADPRFDALLRRAGLRTAGR